MVSGKVKNESVHSTSHYVVVEAFAKKNPVYEFLVTLFGSVIYYFV